MTGFSIDELKQIAEAFEGFSVNEYGTGLVRADGAGIFLTNYKCSGATRRTYGDFPRNRELLIVKPRELLSQSFGFNTARGVEAYIKRLAKFMPDYLNDYSRALDMLNAQKKATEKAQEAANRIASFFGKSSAQLDKPFYIPAGDIVIHGSGGNALELRNLRLDQIEAIARIVSS